MALISHASFFDFTSYDTWQRQYLKAQTAYYKNEHEELPGWLIAFFKYNTDNFLAPNLYKLNVVCSKQNPANEHHKAYTILFQVDKIFRQIMNKLQQHSPYHFCFSTKPQDGLPFVFIYSALIKILVIPQIQKAYSNRHLRFTLEDTEGLLGSMSTYVQIELACKE